MSAQLRVGIVGYGNLGRGVEIALAQQPDMRGVAIFTRRDPKSVAANLPVHPISELSNFKSALDVLILCGGSKSDLPVQTPQLAGEFTLVDSFDTHPKIPAHFAAVDERARAAGTVAIISTGWDPGLFSLNRLYAAAILPRGASHTFWGPGLSQGHSDALRRIPGVAQAVQYTVPVAEELARVRAGEKPQLSGAQQHQRECYVVLAEGADPAEIEQQIVTMPDYFAPYETTVNFISAAEFQAQHTGMPHGGQVIHSGSTADGVQHTISYSLQLDSNPEFTASVLVAYARAAARLRAAGASGAKTPLDIAPALLSPKDAETLRRELL